MLQSAPRWATLIAAAATTLLTTTFAFADEPPGDASWRSDEPQQLPAPPDAPPDAKLPDLSEYREPTTPPNVQVQPDGRVVVTRTPDRGVDVHARTPSGTVHAYGCDRVVFDPYDKSGPLPPGAPPPCAAPPRPPVPPPAPPPYYAPPPRYYPAVTTRAVFRKSKPQYAPDRGRTAALITSSLVFGLGTVAAGSTYLLSISERGIGDCSLIESCGNRQAAPALYTLGAVMTFTPSIPRFVVGDVGMGLLWTGLRGGSFALGTAVNWGPDGGFMPVTFALLAPLTLGIVDLATTPHRENLRPRVKVETASFQLDGLGPTTMIDRAGKTVPALGAMGRF